MKQVIYILLCMLCIPFSGSAQISIEKELEFDYDKFSKHRWTPFDQQGLIAHSTVKNTESKDKTIQIGFYNETFELLKTNEVLIPKKYAYMKNISSTKTTHLIYKHEKKNKYFIVSSDLNTQKTIHIEKEFPKNSLLYLSFKVLGDYFYAIKDAYHKKETNDLFRMNWKTGEHTKYSFQLSEDEKVNRFQINSASKEILVYTKKKYKKEKPRQKQRQRYKIFLPKYANQLFVYRFSSTGELIKRIDFPKETRYIPRFDATYIGDGQYFFTSYSSRNTGIYTLITRKNEEHQYHFYPYSDFNSARNFEPSVWEKKRQIPNELYYHLQLSTIKKVEDGYVILGELYNKITTTAHLGETIQENFHGYYYERAVMLKLDLDGQVLWDKVLDLGFSCKNALNHRKCPKPLKLKTHLIWADQTDTAFKTIRINKNQLFEHTFSKDGKEENTTELVFNMEGVSDISNLRIKKSGDYFIIHGNKKQNGKSHYFIAKTKL